VIRIKIKPTVSGVFVDADNTTTTGGPGTTRRLEGDLPTTGTKSSIPLALAGGILFFGGAVLMIHTRRYCDL
jgi:LPXTG-motif cell wall-anchored protein